MDNMQGRFALLPFKTILTRIKIPDDLDHEGSGHRIPIVPACATRRLIPVPPEPKSAIGRNGQMLSNVRPTFLFSMVTPHGQDRVVSLVLAVIGPPCVMKMDGIYVASKRE